MFGYEIYRQYSDIFAYQSKYMPAMSLFLSVRTKVILTIIIIISCIAMLLISERNGNNHLGFSNNRLLRVYITWFPACVCAA